MYSAEIIPFPRRQAFTRVEPFNPTPFVLTGHTVACIIVDDIDDQVETPAAVFEPRRRPLPLWPLILCALVIAAAIAVFPA